MTAATKRRHGNNLPILDVIQPKHAAIKISKLVYENLSKPPIDSKYSLEFHITDIKQNHPSFSLYSFGEKNKPYDAIKTTQFLQNVAKELFKHIKPTDVLNYDMRILSGTVVDTSDDRNKISYCILSLNFFSVDAKVDYQPKVILEETKIETSREIYTIFKENHQIT